MYFVIGGRHHDFDFARRSWPLYPQEHLRVRVAEDYADTAAIGKCDALISYTCDVRPAEAQQDALIGYVEGGGRWLALHGTNSVFEWTAEGRVTTPRSLPRLMQLLGSQFIAHPPLMDFRVEVTEPGHPIVAGLEPFVVNDELYLSELHVPNRELLHTHYNGKAQRGFTEKEWFSDEPRPVLYRTPGAQAKCCTLPSATAGAAMTCNRSWPSTRPWALQLGVAGVLRAARSGIAWVARLEAQ